MGDVGALSMPAYRCIPAARLSSWPVLPLALTCRRISKPLSRIHELAGNEEIMVPIYYLGALNSLRQAVIRPSPLLACAARRGAWVLHLKPIVRPPECSSGPSGRTPDSAGLGLQGARDRREQAY
jgi:hypothetical protein